MTELRTWHKSSYSVGAHQDCLEVAETSKMVLVRDTKNRHLGHLTVSAAEWRAFVSAVRADEL